MIRNAGSRSDALRYQIKQSLAAPRIQRRIEPAAVPAVKEAQADLAQEIQGLQTEIQRLRSEVQELTHQCWNLVTLPPGTQLNLPLQH